jgi:hypothetical protein
MDPGDDVARFRMELWVRALNVVLPGLAFLLLAVMLLSGNFGGFAWFAPPIVGIGGWLVVRIARMRVEFDRFRLRVFGYLGTRIIDREALVDLDVDDLDFPLVTWRSASGRIRLTPLSALQLASSPLLPRSMYERRRAFLRALDAWAGGAAG